MRSRSGRDSIPAHVQKFFDRQQFMTIGYDWFGNPVRHGRFSRLYRTEEAIRRNTFWQVGEYFDGRDTLLRLRFDTDPDFYAENPQRVFPPGVLIGELLINKTDLAIIEYKFATPSDRFLEYSAYRKIDGKYYPQRSSFSWAFDSDYHQFPKVFNIFFYTTEVVTDPKAIRKTRKGRRIQYGEPMSTLRIRDRPEFWQGEERLLQLPADEVLRFELERVLELEDIAAPPDSVTQDSSK